MAPDSRHLRRSRRPVHPFAEPGHRAAPESEPTSPAEPDRGPAGLGRNRHPSMLDGEVGAISGAQHGVVSHSSLRSLGFSQGSIDHRVARGRLLKLWPGTYAVGDLAMTRHGKVMAGVLTSGEGAIASRHTAAFLLGLMPWLEPISITAPKRRKPKSGLTLHVEPIPADERTVVDGIPITAPTRTIFDLAREESVSSLRAMLDEVRRRGLPVEPAIDELLRRHPRRPGATRLRQVLAEIESQAGVTRSVFEAEFLPFLASIGFPRPLVNHRIDCGSDAYLVDLAWPQLLLAIELDGHAYHSGRAALERDKRRDRKLSAIGYKSVRVTWRQFQHEREDLARDLVQIYASLAARMGGSHGT